MEITPQEEANPVLLAFKKITTQLEKLAERERRVEEREGKAQEREQALIEQHNKVSMMMLKIVDKADNFQKNMVDVETRTKTYLSDYFKELPPTSIVVHEERWSIDSTTQRSFYIFLFGMLVSGLLVYFASPHVDVVRLEHQSQQIESLAAKLNYMIEKNPKTAKNYEATKAQ